MSNTICPDCIQTLPQCTRWFVGPFHVTWSSQLRWAYRRCLCRTGPRWTCRDFVSGLQVAGRNFLGRIGFTAVLGRTFEKPCSLRILPTESYRLKQKKVATKNNSCCKFHSSRFSSFRLQLKDLYSNIFCRHPRNKPPIYFPSQKSVWSIATVGLRMIPPIAVQGMNLIEWKVS